MNINFYRFHIYDHVYVGSEELKLPVKFKRGIFKRLLCLHRNVELKSYTRTNGPSFMDDAFAGTFCSECGTIIEERQTY